MADRLSTLDLVEGLQLGHAVAALHELGVLAALGPGSAVAEIAARHQLDPGLLGGALAYLAARTDLVVREGDGYAITAQYTPHARFLLDLYALAHGANTARLAEILRRPAMASGLVDGRAHARAFAQMAGQTGHPLAPLLLQLGCTEVLDLGCADAGLLIEVARAAPGFVGWGLERNPSMRRMARARVRAAGVGARVRVLAGDAFRLDTSLPAAIRARVRTVTVSQVVNELFGDGDQVAVSWLRALREQLPGRTLLVADYYGQLGLEAAQRETLVHDFAQLLSGQGIPPASRAAWEALYARAGCRLAGVIEDSATTRFVHIVAL